MTTSALNLPNALPLPGDVSYSPVADTCWPERNLRRTEGSEGMTFTLRPSCLRRMRDLQRGGGHIEGTQGAQ